MKKIATLVAPFLVFVGVVSFTSSARAADSNDHNFTGIVSNLDTGAMTFTLGTPHSGDVTVNLNGDTTFTDKDGSTRHLGDLVDGIRVRVTGDFSDTANSIWDVEKVTFRHD